MVERINKPEAPSPHRVQAAKETKEDQSRREQERESEEKYQKSKSSGNWQKFRGRAMTIKPVRVPRERINRVLFRNTILRSGVCILEATVVWKDGRKTEPALFLLSRPEDFMRLKGLKRGQIVPERFWAKGEEIEIGVVQAESPSGSWGIQEVEEEHKEKAMPVKKRPSWLVKIGLADAATGRFQWTTLLVYIIGLAVVGLIIYSATK